MYFMFEIILSCFISWNCLYSMEENMKGKFFLFPTNINQWQPINLIPDQYTADNLYDYIDGNAEVYRSLGVKEVFAYRWSRPKEADIIVDIFDMGDSNGAYGAYHNDIRDQKEIGIGAESEYMNNSLAFWKSKYFICITGMGDSHELNQTILELGKCIDRQIPDKGNPPKIIHVLPDKGLMKSHIHYFKDFNLLNVHYFISNENILGIDNGCEGVLVRYSLPESQEQFNVIIIKYPKKERAKIIAKNLKEILEQSKEFPTQEKASGIWEFKSILIHQKKNYLILIIDWQKKEIGDLYLNQIINKIE